MDSKDLEMNQEVKGTNSENNSMNEYQQEQYAEENTFALVDEEQSKHDVIANDSDEDPYDTMITFLTGREKSERSSKERSIIFPVRVSTLLLLRCF